MYRQKDNKMTIGKKIPQVPTKYTEEEMRERKELSCFSGCYIFVNTNFKRKSEPIFALAFCEGRRRLALDKPKLIFKSDEEVFEIIGEFVKEHYIQEDADAGIWGKIVNYVYHHKDGQTYVFDKDGELLEDVKVQESRARLSLK